MEGDRSSIRTDLRASTMINKTGENIIPNSEIEGLTSDGRYCSDKSIRPRGICPVLGHEHLIGFEKFKIYIYKMLFPNSFI